MEDFYKKFKESLENRPEPEIGAHLWTQLEKELDQDEEEPKKTFTWSWIAAAILLLLLLGSNIFSIIEIQKAKDNITRLEHKRDTIFQTKIIYQTDTIFQTNTVIKEVYLDRPAVFSEINYGTKPIKNSFQTKDKNPLNNKKEVYTNTFDNKNAIFPLLLNKETAKNKAATDEDLNKVIRAKTKAMGLTLPLAKNTKGKMIDALSPLGLEKVKIEFSQPTIIVKRRKTLMQRLYTMRPKGFRLGITGAWLNPVTKDVGDNFSYSLGLEGKIKLTSTFQLWMKAAYMQLNFHTINLSEVYGFTHDLPPSEDYIFADAEGSQPSLQATLGIQYAYKRLKRWQPFVGVGYALVKPLSYDIEYKYVNEKTEEFWGTEESVPLENWVNNFLIFRGGVNYKINAKWEWQTQLSYRKNISKTGLKALSLAGLESGIHYNF